MSTHRLTIGNYSIVLVRDFCMEVHQINSAFSSVSLTFAVFVYSILLARVESSSACIDNHSPSAVVGSRPIAAVLLFTS